MVVKHGLLGRDGRASRGLSLRIQMGGLQRRPGCWNQSHHGDNYIRNDEF